MNVALVVELTLCMMSNHLQKVYMKSSNDLDQVVHHRKGTDVLRPHLKIHWRLKSSHSRPREWIELEMGRVETGEAVGQLHLVLPVIIRLPVYWSSSVSPRPAWNQEPSLPLFSFVNSSSSLRISSSSCSGACHSRRQRLRRQRLRRRPSACARASLGDPDYCGAYGRTHTGPSEARDLFAR